MSLYVDADVLREEQDIGIVESAVYESRHSMLAHCVGMLVEHFTLGYAWNRLRTHEVHMWDSSARTV